MRSIFTSQFFALLYFYFSITLTKVRVVLLKHILSVWSNGADKCLLGGTDLTSCVCQRYEEDSMWPTAFSMWWAVYVTFDLLFQLFLCALASRSSNTHIVHLSVICHHQKWNICRLQLCTCDDILGGFYAASQTTVGDTLSPPHPPPTPPTPPKKNKQKTPTEFNI